MRGDGFRGGILSRNERCNAGSVLPVAISAGLGGLHCGDNLAIIRRSKALLDRRCGLGDAEGANGEGRTAQLMRQIAQRFCGLDSRVSQCLYLIDEFSRTQRKERQQLALQKQIAAGLPCKMREIEICCRLRRCSKEGGTWGRMHRLRLLTPGGPFSCTVGRPHNRTQRRFSGAFRDYVCCMNWPGAQRCGDAGWISLPLWQKPR
jgi:hypothetical protein